MTTFTGPVYIKAFNRDNTQGQLLVTSTTTVNGNTSSALATTIPARSQIVDMLISINVSASNTTTGHTLRVGNATDVQKFAALRVSAVSLYRAGVAPNVTNASVASWKIGASDEKLFLDLTAAAGSAGDSSTLDGLFTIVYITNPNVP